MGEQGQVLAIFLDGYEPSLEAAMRAEGELPNLAALHDRGASVRLEHGAAQRTGLAGEHLSTGRSPDASGRHAAVDFDPEIYAARQVGTRFPTFVEHLRAPTVVFDVPYFDLHRTTNACGVVNWGAHDPGIPTQARPDTLVDELHARFGSYPAPDFLYCTPWGSPELCETMGASLASAVSTRSRASLWLLGERLPDWSLALVSVSEPHSAIEGLWHGIDPEHRLASVPSAAPAGDGVRSVYRAVDRLVGDHVDAFPDATVVVFSMHGMGTNSSDVASMALLPELLYRHATSRRRLQAPPTWTSRPTAPPMVESSTSWSGLVRNACWQPLPEGPVRGRVGRLARKVTRKRPGQLATAGGGLGWMPASWYADAWPTMEAFALPSFYDGRVRVNLVGRERRGMVPVDRYDDVLDEIEALIRGCLDPLTGRSVVASLERVARERQVDPHALGRSDADLVVVWNGPLALDHPDVGLVGPLPYRRTGGHTAPLGSAVIAGRRVPRADLGCASAFDVVPTLFSLLGEEPPAAVSGHPLRLA